MIGELILNGIVKYAEAVESGTGKNGKEWTKQGAVLETQERYPRTVYFVMWGDNIPQGGIREGEYYEVSLFVSSREWQGKWYTNVSATRVTPWAMTQPAYQQPMPIYQQPAYQQPQPQPQPQPAPTQAEGDTVYRDTDGSPLPF